MSFYAALESLPLDTRRMVERFMSLTMIMLEEQVRELENRLGSQKESAEAPSKKIRRELRLEYNTAKMVYQQIEEGNVIPREEGDLAFKRPIGELESEEAYHRMTENLIAWHRRRGVAKVNKDILSSFYCAALTLAQSEYPFFLNALDEEAVRDWNFCFTVFLTAEANRSKKSIDWLDNPGRHPLDTSNVVIPPVTEKEFVNAMKSLTPSAKNYLRAITVDIMLFLRAHHSSPEMLGRLFETLLGSGLPRPLREAASDYLPIFFRAMDVSPETNEDPQQIVNALCRQNEPWMPIGELRKRALFLGSGPLTWPVLTAWKLIALFFARETESTAADLLAPLIEVEIPADDLAAKFTKKGMIAGALEKLFDGVPLQLFGPTVTVLRYLRPLLRQVAQPDRIDRFKSQCHILDNQAIVETVMTTLEAFEPFESLFIEQYPSVIPALNDKTAVRRLFLELEPSIRFIEEMPNGLSGESPENLLRGLYLMWVFAMNCEPALKDAIKEVDYADEDTLEFLLDRMNSMVGAFAMQNLITPEQRRAAMDERRRSKGEKKKSVEEAFFEEEMSEKRVLN